MHRIQPKFAANGGLKVALSALALGGASLGTGYMLNPNTVQKWPSTADRFERVKETINNKFVTGLQKPGHDWVRHIQEAMQDPRNTTPEMEAFFTAEANAIGLPTAEQKNAIELSSKLLKEKPLNTFSDLQPVLNEFADKYYADQPELKQQFKNLSAQTVKKLESDVSRKLWSERLFLAGAVTILGTVLITLAAGISQTHDVEIGHGIDGKPVYFFRPKK
jgi:hypothetical protein